jgi:AcrR family transcriptional regulator
MGRHREFDPDEALDAALTVFWRQGFEGTSYSDLTEATGVARPGLYTAFGNKEELFLKALDRYEATRLCFLREALEEPTALAVVRRILVGFAGLHTDPAGPAGCLGVNGALACSDAVEPIRRELAARRGRLEALLRQRLERARDGGDLAPDSDPDGLARYVMTIALGMAVQAKAGATREQLHRLAELVLQLWPAGQTAGAPSVEDFSGAEDGFGRPLFACQDKLPKETVAE